MAGRFAITSHFNYMAMLKQVSKSNRNVLILKHVFDTTSKSQKYLMLSDIHWDNPKCNRELLEKHLKQAQRENAKVLVNGDFFCLMQGKGDPRRSKDDIRPEHNKANYLDALILDAVEWWGKYKDVLLFIGYGNHETSIIKHQETDVLQRFVDLFNATHKPKHTLQAGGYGGWVVMQYNIIRNRNGVTNMESQMSKYIHYFHGSGGGGPVTANMIQHQRNSAYLEGADLIWIGHTHDSFYHTRTKHSINKTTFKPENKDIEFMQTPSYKQEFDDRHSGWHVERGAPPKPLGGYWLDLRVTRLGPNGKLYWEIKKTN